jgi:hypothetical protein
MIRDPRTGEPMSLRQELDYIERERLANIVVGSIALIVLCVAIVAAFIVAPSLSGPT